MSEAICRRHSPNSNRIEEEKRAVCAITRKPADNNKMMEVGEFEASGFPLSHSSDVSGASMLPESASFCSCNTSGSRLLFADGDDDGNQ